MAEFLYASAHLAGDFPNPGNAVGDTPSTWAGDLNANSSYTSRWAMADPVDPLTAAATQTVRVVARKGSNTGTPTIALNLYEAGVLVRQILAATNVTNFLTSQTLVATFDSSEVGNPADAEIEVVQTAAGGNPSTRNCAQISHIEWEADTTVAADPPAAGTFDVPAVTSVGWAGFAPVVPDASGTFAVSATSTVGWVGNAPAVAGAGGAFAAPASTSVGWFGSRASTGAAEASATTSVGWTGHTATTGTFDVVAATTTGWTGVAPSVGGAAGTFAVTATTSVGWTAERTSTGVYPATATTAVGWSGEAPLVPGSGGIFAVSAATTVGWAADAPGVAGAGGTFAATASTSVGWVGNTPANGGIFSAPPAAPAKVVLDGRHITPVLDTRHVVAILGD